MRMIIIAFVFLGLGVVKGHSQSGVMAWPASGWSDVGDVAVFLAKPFAAKVKAGEGVFAYIPGRSGRTHPLVSGEAYGDLELEFQYLLAGSSEATLYLHGVYPITLRDDDNPSEPAIGINGTAAGYLPRQAVGRSAGLWQHLKVVFLSPKFDGSGRKTDDARLLSVQLNGVIIHENIVLSGADEVGLPQTAAFRITPIKGALAIKQVYAKHLHELPQHSVASEADPILIATPVNVMHRSFMDIPNGDRITHAISIGHPQQVHYTYDLSTGNLFQVWRGGFLDATPMWHRRGNGTAKPLGSVIHFGGPSLTIGKLSTPDSPWPADSSGSGYRTKGYRVNVADLPTFRYHIYGGEVADAIRPLRQGTGFSRIISSRGLPQGAYARLAASSHIVHQGKGVYLIGNHEWYLQVEKADSAEPFIRQQGDCQELLIPVIDEIRYSIIF